LRIACVQRVFGRGPSLPGILKAAPSLVPILPRPSRPFPTTTASTFTAVPPLRARPRDYQLPLAPLHRHSFVRHLPRPMFSHRAAVPISRKSALEEHARARSVRSLRPRRVEEGRECMWSGRSHTGKACPGRLPCVRGVVGGGVQGFPHCRGLSIFEIPLPTSARRGRNALPTHRCTTAAPGPQRGGGAARLRRRPTYVLPHRPWAGALIRSLFLGPRAPTHRRATPRRPVQGGTRGA